MFVRRVVPKSIWHDEKPFGFFSIHLFPIDSLFTFFFSQNDDEDNPTGGRKKPTLVSIPNPLYSGSRAFAEPFGVRTSNRNSNFLCGKEFVLSNSDLRGPVSSWSLLVVFHSSKYVWSDYIQNAWTQIESYLSSVVFKVQIALWNLVSIQLRTANFVFILLSSFFKKSLKEQFSTQEKEFVICGLALRWFCASCRYIYI